MKEIDKISVVIPVYNVMEYVGQCIESVCKQTYKNLEIIIVDDGSTDGSGEVCQEYAKKDSRIKLIRQKNSGVVSARNAGINLATGTYIGFVDADDWIDEQMYESLVEASDNYDLITSGYFKNYSNARDEICCFDIIPKGIYKGKEEMETIWGNMIYWENSFMRGFTVGICNKLFKLSIVKSFFSNISTKLQSGEDLVFLYYYILKCNSIKITHQVHYHYRMRQGSATHSVNDTFLQNANIFYLSLVDIFSSHYMKDRLLCQLEQLTIEIVCKGLNYSMGFSHGGRLMMYILPYREKLNGKDIVLYGAGRVGDDYFNQLKRNGECRIVSWVDRNYQQYTDKDLEIHDITDLQKLEYDYVIIAVKDSKLAQSITKELVERGIMRSKILWDEPEYILR